MTDPAVQSEIDAKRAKLESTLDEIEERLNVQKRAEEVGDRVKETYADNPVPFYVGAAAAVAVVGGLIAWALFTKD